MAESKKLECLIRLQEVISQKLVLENEAAKIPEELLNDNKALDESNSVLNALNEELEAAREEETSLSIRYQDAERQSVEYQKVIETLSTQREYEAMMKQIAEAGSHAKSLLLSRNAKIEEIKSLQVKVEAQSQISAALTEKVEAESQEVEGKLAEINAKLAALDKECEEIKGDVISDEYLTKFYNVSKKKGGEGLVAVKGQVCTGCNTVLPMQFVIDLRIKQVNDEIDTCPYCSRMIYFDENLPAEEEKRYIFDDADYARFTQKIAESADDILGDDDDDDDVIAVDGDDEEL